MLHGAKIADTYPIKCLDTHGDLVEQQGKSIKDLIFVPLVDGNPEHVVQISSNLDQVTRDQQSYFFKKMSMSLPISDRHVKHRPNDDGALVESGLQVMTH